jgi:hypothetical protein
MVTGQVGKKIDVQEYLVTYEPGRNLQTKIIKLFYLIPEPKWCEINLEELIGPELRCSKTKKKLVAVYITFCPMLVLLSLLFQLFHFS